MNDNIKKLYDVLSSKGYYTKSFEDFSGQWSDEGYRKKVYGVVSRDGLYTKDYNSFVSKYSTSAEPIKKKEPTALPSPSDQEPSSSGTQPKKPQPRSVFLQDAETGEKLEILTGYPGKEGIEYNYVNGKWRKRKPGQTSWFTITNQGSINELNRFFNKQKTEDQVKKQEAAVKRAEAQIELSDDEMAKILGWDKADVQKAKEGKTKPVKPSVAATVTPTVAVSQSSVIDKQTANYAKANIEVAEGKAADVNQRAEYYNNIDLQNKIKEAGFDVDVNGDMNTPKNKSALAKYEAFTKKNAEDMDKKNKFLSSVYSIDDAIGNSDEETLVSVLRDKYKGTGFVFEETGLGDTIRISYAPTSQMRSSGTYSNTIEIPLGEENSAALIKSFMENAYMTDTEKKVFAADTADTDSYTMDLVSKMAENPYKYDESLVNEDWAASTLKNRYEYLSGESINLENLYRKYDEAVKDYNENPTQDKKAALSNMLHSIEQKKLDLMREYEKVEKFRTNLDKVAGIRLAKNEKIGNTLGMLAGAVAQGATSIGKTLTLAAADVLPYALGEDLMNPIERAKLENQGYTESEILDQSAKELKRFIMPRLEEGIQNVASLGTTTREYIQSEDRGDIAKAATFLAESIGTAITGGGNPLLQKLAFASMSYNSMEQQMMTSYFDKVVDPVTGEVVQEGLTEHEKKLVSIPYAFVIGALEKLGWDAMSNKGLLSKVAKNVIRKTMTDLPKDASIAAVKREINKSVGKMVASGAIRIVNGALSEGAVEGVQQLAEIGIKNVANAVTEVNYFKDVPDITTTDGIIAALDAAKEDAYYGALGGLMFSGIDVSRETASNMFYQPKLDKEFDMFYESIMNDDTRTLMKMKVESDLAAGEISKEDADQKIKALDENKARLDKIPTDLSSRDKRESFNLLMEREKIEKQIAGKEDSLVAAQKARIAEINNELQTISQNAVQKQTTDESVLREEQPEVGLQEVEQGDTKQEVVTEEGQQEEVAPSLVTLENATEFERKAADIDTAEGSDRATKASRAAKSVLRALPGVKVHLHTDTNSYRDGVARASGIERKQIDVDEDTAMSAGSYINGEIHIDLSNPMANMKTVYHEAFHHAITKIAPKEGQLREMTTGLKKALSGRHNDMVAQIEEFENMYSGDLGYVDADRAEEFLSEMMGFISSDDNIKKLDINTLQKIANVINKIAKKLGFDKKFGRPVLSEAASRQEIVDFMNTLSRGFREGRDVSKLVVGSPEVKAKIKKQISEDWNGGESNFTRWAGGYPVVSGSDIQDIRTGNGVIVLAYHGTTNEFYEFDASVKGNIEGHLGKVNYFTSDYYDAQSNYLSEGADLTSRIDRRQEELESELEEFLRDDEFLDMELVMDKYDISEQELNDIYPSGIPSDIQPAEISRLIAEKELKGGEERVLEVYVKLNNPIVLGGRDTWFDVLELSDDLMDEAAQEIADDYGITIEEAKADYDYEVRDRAIENSGEQNKIIEALENALSDNGYDSYMAQDILGDSYFDTEVDLNSLEKSMRKADLYENYDGQLAGSQVIADFFQNLGFDGIILTDVSERFKGMRLSESTSHIHVFDDYSNQIKLADGTNIEFNESTRDIRKQLSGKPKKTSTQKKIEKTVGVSKKTKKVTVNEATALKDQLRLEARAARQSAQSLKQKQRQLVALINEMKRGGIVTAQQASALAKRVVMTNVDNPIMVERMLQYAERLFERADYQEKLQEAKSLQKKIKSKLQSNGLQASVVSIAKDFSKIQPWMLSDIDAYIEQANNVLNAVRPSRLGVTTGVDIDNVMDQEQVSVSAQMRTSMSFKDVGEYIENANKEIEEYRKAEILAVNDDLVQAGVISKDMNLKEILEIMNELKDPSSDIDPADKKAAILAYIGSVMDVYRPIVESMINGKDAFTGEAVELTDRQKEVASDMLKIDVTKMDVRDAVRVIEAMDNFITNGIIDGVEAITSTYKGQQKIKEALGKGIKTKGFGLLGAGTIWGDLMMSVPIAAEWIFDGAKRGQYILDSMGFSDFVRGVSSAVKTWTGVVDSYSAEFNKKKPNGKAFMAAENVYERGMYAFLKRTVAGDQKAQDKELNRKIKLIKDSVEVLRSIGGKKEIKMADVYEALIGKLGLNDANLSISDIEARVDKINVDAVNWWISTWSDSYDKLADVSQSVYNTILDKDMFYTPDKFSTVKPESAMVEDAINTMGGGFAGLMSYTYDKKTGVLMPSSKTSSMADGRYVNLNFDNNNQKAYKAALIDINTATATKQIKGFLKSKEYDRLIPDMKARELFMDKINNYILTSRNKQVETRDGSAAELERLGRLWASLGAVRALGSFTQPIKQAVPPLLVTVAMTRNNATIASTKAQHDWINATGMPIANRGLEAASAFKDVDKTIDSNVLSGNISKAVDAVEAWNKFILKNLLAKPDVLAARSMFISFYKQELERKGKSTDIDYSDTSNMDKDALNYAQTMVDRQMSASDSALLGRLFSSNDSKWKMIKNVMFPFMSFVINQKSRVTSDIKVLLSNTATAEDKSIAWNSLAGFSVEFVAFNAIGFFVRLTLLNWVADVIADAGDDDDEDTWKDKMRREWGYLLSNVTKDVLSPHPLLDEYPVSLVDMILEKSSKSTMLDEAKEKLKIENEARDINGEELLEGDKAQEFIDNYIEKHRAKAQVYESSSGGIYSITIDKFKEASKILRLATTGEYEVEITKGKTNTYYLDEEGKKKIKDAMYLHLFPAIVGFPAELSTVYRRVEKKVKKEHKLTEKQHEALNEVLKETGRQKEGKLEKYLVTKMRATQNESASERVLNELDWIESRGGLKNERQVQKYIEIFEADGSVGIRDMEEIQKL